MKPRKISTQSETDKKNENNSGLNKLNEMNCVLIFSKGFDTYNQVFAQSALLSPSSFFLLQIHNVVWWKENNQILH